MPLTAQQLPTLKVKRIRVKRADAFQDEYRERTAEVLPGGIERLDEFFGQRLRMFEPFGVKCHVGY